MAKYNDNHVMVILEHSKNHIKLKVVNNISMYPWEEVLKRNISKAMSYTDIAEYYL